jgi:hypothetical protein
MKIRQKIACLLASVIALGVTTFTPLTVHATGGTMTLSYTKTSDTTAVINVQTSNATQVRLPDGNWSTQSNFTYSVSKNGTFDFEARSFGQDGIQKSIIVNDLFQTIPVTANPSVTLNLKTDDTLSGASQMRFSNDNSGWSGFEALGSTKNWNLPTGDGLKKVYVQYQDVATNISDSRYDQVYLDQTAPTAGFTINNGSIYTNSKNVNLTFNITDNISGVSTILISNDGVNYTEIPFTSSTAWVIPGTLGNNKVYVKAKDKVGNISSPVTQQIYYDNVLPFGSVLINNGDTATNTRDVILTMNFGDANAGVAKVKIIEGSNSYEFPTVPTSPTTIPWTLQLGQTGKVTLEVTDKAGNVYRTDSNVINIITLKITGFKLNDVVNPVVFTKSTPYVSKSWTFAPQPMMAGGNITYETDFDLYDQGTLSSVTNGTYTVEIVGANGYDKKLTGNFSDRVYTPTKGFVNTLTLPLDAPNNAKVYVSTSITASLTTTYSTVTQTAYFPGPDNLTSAQIGYIQGNIQQSLKFNEVR